VTYAGHRAQHSSADGTVEHLTAHLSVDGAELVLPGAGNGPVDAFVTALRNGLGLPIHVINYHEHAIGAGEDAMAVAYVQLRVGTDRTVYGVGRDANIVTATLRALVARSTAASRAARWQCPRARRRRWHSLLPSPQPFSRPRGAGLERRNRLHRPLRRGGQGRYGLRGHDHLASDESSLSRGRERVGGGGPHHPRIRGWPRDWLILSYALTQSIGRGAVLARSILSRSLKRRSR
jgi:hypothetical protein